MKSTLFTMFHKDLCGFFPLISEPYLLLRAWQGHLSVYAMVVKAGTIFLSQQKQFNSCLLMPAYFVQLFTLWPFWALRYSISGLVSFKILLDTGICILLLPFVRFPCFHSVLRPAPMPWSLGKRDLQSPKVLDWRASTLPLSYFMCVPGWHRGFYF